MMLLSNLKMPVAVGLLLTTAACTSLQPVIEPAAFFANRQPGFVVVTTVEAEEFDDPVVFLNPAYNGTTLSGLVDGEAKYMPVVRIRTLRANQPDRRKTTLAIIGGVVAAGAFGYLIAGSGSKIDDPTCLPPNCEM